MVTAMAGIDPRRLDAILCLHPVGDPAGNGTAGRLSFYPIEIILAMAVPALPLMFAPVRANETGTD